EGPCQAHVPSVPQDVPYSVGARDLHGAVGRAVVDDEDLDGVDARDLPGNRGEDGRQRVLLVEARDLDEQFHGFLRVRPVRGEGDSVRVPAWAVRRGETCRAGAALSPVMTAARPSP